MCPFRPHTAPTERRRLTSEKSPGEKGEPMGTNPPGGRKEISNFVLRELFPGKGGRKNQHRKGGDTEGRCVYPHCEKGEKFFSSERHRWKKGSKKGRKTVQSNVAIKEKEKKKQIFLGDRGKRKKRPQSTKITGGVWLGEKKKERPLSAGVPKALQ